MEVPRPKVIESYDNNMGGVDIADQVISYYRNHSRTSKYTMRVVLHLLDLSCANSWLEYRGDCNLSNQPAMDSMAFKLQVAYSLIEGITDQQTDTTSESDCDDCGSNGRKRPRPLPSDQKQVRGVCHMPEVLPAYTGRQRCRYPGCSEKTRFSCKTCKVFLCLSSERNCYSLFHMS